MVGFEDNSDMVLAELDKKVEKCLQQMGEIFLESCVDKTNEIDMATGRPTVDTGRYRAGWGYITPTDGKMSGTEIVRIDPSNPVSAEDDISGKRADANTVVIANNVPYASDLEAGFGSHNGGAHARWILKRAVEEKIPDIKNAITQEFTDGETMLIDMDTGEIL